jgi:DNA repair photolyase
VRQYGDEYKAKVVDSSPLLFDLGAKPTTRDVARIVKAAGTDGLSDAQRRADAATYQEVTCRSALNPVAGMPFRWTLNPYRGCTHGCHYCFARRYHTQFELNVGDEFASVILVKTNLAEVLARELDRPGWRREEVAFGTATDPYQPIEGHYRLTRRSLAALAESRTPVGLVTKGPMVVRDRDVLLEVSKRASCSVCVSVPTVDEGAWRALEPGTAHPLQRLRAVRELVDAGIHAGVLMAPVVPGFTTAPAKLERTIKAIADHGARFVGSQLLYLKDGTRAHFMEFLSREFPDLRTRYNRLYAGAYAPRPYTDRVQGLIAMLKSRYGPFAPRAGRDEAGPPVEGPSQAAFAWNGS